MLEAPLAPSMPKISSDLEAPMDFQPKEILPEPTIIESPLLSGDRDPEPVDLDDYTVLGDTIDHEMKERIREAIMETGASLRRYE